MEKALIERVQALEAQVEALSGIVLEMREYVQELDKHLSLQIEGLGKGLNKVRTPVFGPLPDRTEK